MIVEILKADKSVRFPKVGEHYEAESYMYDSDKVTLMYLVDPKTGKRLEKQYCDCSPLINEYKHNVRVVRT